jgi:hypothetical protein
LKLVATFYEFVLKQDFWRRFNTHRFLPETEPSGENSN